jgi:hypothetical protein
MKQGEVQPCLIVNPGEESISYFADCAVEGHDFSSTNLIDTKTQMGKTSQGVNQESQS